jgi:hypothetical protein
VHIELWPIDRPQPFPKNARHWNAAAVAKVASSIREYGFRQPIVVDIHGVICIGHLRLAAAKSLSELGFDLTLTGFDVYEIDIPICRDCAWRCQTGRRNCGFSWRQSDQWRALVSCF